MFLGNSLGFLYLQISENEFIQSNFYRIHAFIQSNFYRIHAFESLLIIRSLITSFLKNRQHIKNKLLIQKINSTYNNDNIYLYLYVNIKELNIYKLTI